MRLIIRSEEISSDGLRGGGPPGRSVSLSTDVFKQQRRQVGTVREIVAQPGSIVETEPPVKLRTPQVGIDQQDVLVDVKRDADGEIGRREGLALAGRRAGDQDGTGRLAGDRVKNVAPQDLELLGLVGLRIVQGDETRVDPVLVIGSLCPGQRCLQNPCRRRSRPGRLRLGPTA